MSISILTAKIIRDEQSKNQVDIGSLIINENGRMRTLRGDNATVTNADRLSGLSVEEVKKGGDGIRAGEYTRGEILSSSAHRNIRMLINCDKSNTAFDFMLGVTNEEDILHWGKSDNNWAIQGKGETTYWLTTIYNPKKGIAKIKEIQPFVEGAFVLYEDGDLYAIGRYNAGCVGIGNASGVLYNLTLCLDNVETFVVSGTQSYDWENNFTIAIKKDGTLWGCGENSSGQLGLGHTADQINWTPIPYPEFKYDDEYMVEAIAFDAVYGGTILRSNRGLLYVSGRNKFGELGLGDTDDRLRFTLVKALEDINIVDVKATQGGRISNTRKTNHSVIALSEDGDVYTWGSNVHGALGAGDTEDRLSPEYRASGVKKIYASKSWRGVLGYVTEGNNLYLAGPKWGYFFGDGNNDGTENTFKKVLGDVKALYIGTGIHRTEDTAFMALSNAGALLVWGANSKGNAGVNTTSLVENIAAVPFNYVSNIKDIAMYGDSARLTTAILLEDGRVFSAGDDTRAQVVVFNTTSSIRQFFQTI